MHAARTRSLLLSTLLGVAACGLEKRPDVLPPLTVTPKDAGAVDTPMDAASVDAPADAPSLDASGDAPALDAPTDVSRVDVVDRPRPTDVPPISSVRPGMRRGRGVTLESTAFTTPHAARILQRGADMVVIDSTDVQLVTEVAGGFRAELLVTFTDASRCTVGALNGAQVVCATHGHQVVESIDVDRRAPVSRFSATADPLRGVFDVARQSDGLWIATVDGALEVIPFGADGAPDASRRRVVARGSFRTVVGDGASRVAAWDAATDTVSIFEGTALLRGVTVDGPLIGGRWRAAAFYAALGSAGVARIDPTTGTITWRVVPPAVVTSVDLDDTTMIVGATTGAFAYALADVGAGPFGFVPAQYGVLDVAMRGGRAVVLDWRSLSEFALDPTGEATTLDTARGYPVASAAPVAVPARNVGRVPLRVAGTILVAGEVGRFPLNPLMNFGSGVQVGDSESYVNVVRVATTQPPRLGDVWPYHPERFASMQLVLIEASCALQVPLWKEVLYRARHPLPGDAAMVLGLIDNPAQTAQWSALWGLPGRSWSELVELPAGVDAGRAFGLNAVLGGPDTDAIYDLDTSGRVVNVDNQWRGRHGLPPPL